MYFYFFLIFYLKKLQFTDYASIHKSRLIIFGVKMYRLDLKLGKTKSNYSQLLAYQDHAVTGIF